MTIEIRGLRICVSGFTCFIHIDDQELCTWFAAVVALLQNWTFQGPLTLILILILVDWGWKMVKYFGQIPAPCVSMVWPVWLIDKLWATLVTLVGADIHEKVGGSWLHKTDPLLDLFSVIHSTWLQPNIKCTKSKRTQNNLFAHILYHISPGGGLQFCAHSSSF